MRYDYEDNCIFYRYRKNECARQARGKHENFIKERKKQANKNVEV